jgi:hypothetical protein
MIIEKIITTNSKSKAKEAKIIATMYPCGIAKNTKKFTSCFFKNIFYFFIILNCMKVGTCVEGY